MTTSGITVFGQPSQPNHGAGGRIAMDDAVFPTDYVALDLETTGFYPNSCAITEIGAAAILPLPALINGNKICSSFII